MDSFEVSRQRAERLHADAIVAGHDPWKPYAFARAEAARRKLAVEKVPKGDIRLFGARALYDPDALLILHEDAGDEFINAFLITHEIGHVEFGGQAEPSATLDVDLLRSSEAVPIGVDRVADYSQRQRREVQMDLFAREFLLPRAWVRKLHLEDSASAAAVATKLGAPHAVVAQQLLDALLLPMFEIPPEKMSKPLKPDQEEAAKHEGTPFLLEAGPGTGKTQTLVGRVDFLLGKGVAPKKILILTFSNKAAGELSERIAAKHPEAAASIWIGTFHGFGLDVIRRFHDRLGLPADPRLIDRTDAIEFLEDEYPRLDLVHFKDLWDPSRPLADILSAISRANDEVVDAAGYRALADAMLTSASTDEERWAAERYLEVATVFAAYEQLKAAKGCIDLGDLVAMPVRLSESLMDVRDHLASLYEHILVDEYQDVNRSSVRLLKAIAGDGRNLWVVGDVKQSIYRFRGASAFNMARFDREDFKGGQRGRLKRNYRSVGEVVDAFLTFALEMPSIRGSDVGLQAERGEGGRLPEYRSVGTADQEIAAVAEAIEELRVEGYSFRDQAVLSSGNERLGRFAEGLERLGIPVLYLGSLFERDEIKDLLSLLSILVDRRAMGLLRVAAMDAYAVPLADVALVLSHLKQRDCEPVKWVEALDALPEMSAAGRDGLRCIARLLGGFEMHANPWAILCEVLLDRTRMAAEIAAAMDVRARSRGVAIWQFMNFLRTQPPGPGLPISRLLDRIRRLVLLSDERDLRQLPLAAQGIDAVRLMTMHGSKGLEFPVVHIPGMNDGSLPRSPNASLARGIIPPDGLIEGADGKAIDVVRAGLIEEQECLFFVALSRARDRLFLYSPTRTTNGRNRPRSAFITRLGGGVVSRHVVPASAVPPSERYAPIPLTIVGPFTFSDHQLALYERCPRRFLYTHILEVGGRRTETAFMKLHVVVQKVIDVSGPLPGKDPSTEEMKASLEAAWDIHGPADHGYGAEYKRIAWQLVQFYADLVSRMTALPVPELRLPIVGGEIVITPHHVASEPGGTIVMRRVDTGHKASQDDDSLAVAAFHIAATSHSPGCKVEVVHLSDAKITSIAMTPRVLANRRTAIEKMGSAVKAGLFPLVESITCPRCPAFFICGRVPAGPLTKKSPCDVTGRFPAKRLVLQGIPVAGARSA
jgi:superfamily I DNA/RNA helicase